MKILKFNKQKVALSLRVAFLLFSISVKAQTLEDALGFTETVNDVPEAPINMLIYAGLVVGSYFGIKKIKAC